MRPSLVTFVVVVLSTLSSLEASNGTRSNAMHPATQQEIAEDDQLWAELEAKEYLPDPLDDGEDDETFDTTHDDQAPTAKFQVPQNLFQVSLQLLNYSPLNLRTALRALQAEGILHNTLQDHCNWNILHQAVFNDDVDIARILIREFGFDPRAFDPYFGTCVNLVKSASMANLLKDHDATLDSNPSSLLYDLHGHLPAGLKQNLSVLRTDDDLEYRVSAMVTNLRQTQQSKTVYEVKGNRQNIYLNTLEMLNRRRVVGSAKIKIHFSKELGLDHGGLRVEFILVMRDEFLARRVWIQDKHTDLITLSPDADEADIRLSGFIVSVSIYYRVPLNIRFVPVLYHVICGYNPFRDSNIYSLMKSQDFTFYSGLIRTREMRDDELTELEYPTDSRQALKRLRKNVEGREYLSEYVESVARNRVIDPISAILKHFKNGLESGIDVTHISSYVSPDEIKLCISGQADYSADEFRASCKASVNGDEKLRIYGDFWSLIDEFTEEDRVLLLKFFTSLDVLPVGGFPSLEYQPDISFFELPTQAETDDALPHASTCFNNLRIPNYSSRDVLRLRLLAAIRNCGGFGER